VTAIRAGAPKACWKALGDSLWDYWGRLGACGRNRIVAPAPALDFEDRDGTITLGGRLARDRVPMGTSSEVRALVEDSHRGAVRIGAPPRALVLGYQRLHVERTERDYALHTTEYKYTLALSFTDTDAVDGQQWLAIRLESDARTARQSWLLNHPVHHHQLGACDDLRLLSPRGRTLVSFVDAALRAFAADVWGEMYTNLYLHLTEEQGAFRRIAGTERIDHATAATLERLLREGRAERLDWHLELEQWRADVDDRSIVAPELFETFVEPSETR
jgi:hypothetical protein